jgi:hypothetical protein
MIINKCMLALTAILLGNISTSYAFDLLDLIQNVTPPPSQQLQQQAQRTDNQSTNVINDARQTLGYNKNDLAEDLRELNENGLGGANNTSTQARAKALHDALEPDTQTHDLTTVVTNINNSLGGANSTTERVTTVHDILVPQNEATDITTAATTIKTHLSAANTSIKEIIGDIQGNGKTGLAKLTKNGKNPIGRNNGHKFDCRNFDNANNLTDQIVAFLAVFNQTPDNDHVITLPAGTYKNLRAILAALDHQ